MRISPRFLVAITALNGAFCLLAQTELQQAKAAADAPSVLRGRGLEIIDEAGRVRASIKVHPADPKVRMPDATTQADSVVLRLINPDGMPGVKLAASERHVGLALVAEQGHYIQVFHDGIKLTKDHRQTAAWP